MFEGDGDRDVRMDDDVCGMKHPGVLQERFVHAPAESGKRDKGDEREGDAQNEDDGLVPGARDLAPNKARFF